MRVVIDIPEEEYEGLIKEHAYKTCGIGEEYYEVIIANGTPLPKGHGRIGDLDALEQEMINGIKAGNYEEGYEEIAHINNVDDCVECVKYADALIEADKENKE